jgi:hypothetical protein
MPSSIAANYNASYIKTAKPFSAARSAASSDSLNTSSLRTVTIDNGGDNYTIYRSYLMFDISSIESPYNKLYLNIFIAGDVRDIIITYGGIDGLTQTVADYSNYINNGEIQWSDNTSVTLNSYNEFYLNPNSFSYPTKKFLVVGVISTGDFQNEYLGSNVAFIDGIGGVNPPFLRFEFSSGYPNTILGVSSSSISTVNGVSSSSISTVNGV